VLEAAEGLLAAFMRDGMPDRNLFRATVTPMLENVAAGQGPRTMRAVEDICSTHIDVVSAHGEYRPAR
jgi:hypothetical protein